MHATAQRHAPLGSRCACAAPARDSRRSADNGGELVRKLVLILTLFAMAGFADATDSWHSSWSGMSIESRRDLVQDYVTAFAIALREHEPAVARKCELILRNRETPVIEAQLTVMLDAFAKAGKTEMNPAAALLGMLRGTAKSQEGR